MRAISLSISGALLHFTSAARASLPCAHQPSRSPRQPRRPLASSLPGRGALLHASCLPSLSSLQPLPLTVLASCLLLEAFLSESDTPQRPSATTSVHPLPPVPDLTSVLSPFCCPPLLHTEAPLLPACYPPGHLSYPSPSRGVHPLSSTTSRLHGAGGLPGIGLCCLTRVC